LHPGKTLQKHCLLPLTPSYAESAADGYDFLSGPNGTGEIELCSYSGAMLYNDPGNKTVNFLKKIYSEMAGLFPDATFHMGGDEPVSSYY
jgi:N-acetyl-beta-hexosaminidase